MMIIKLSKDLIVTDQGYLDRFTWNEAIELAAEKAYYVCKNDIYVKQAGLEKNCAAEIRKLKK